MLLSRIWLTEFVPVDVDDRTFAESLLARVESETGTVASLEMDPEFRAAVVAGLVEGGVDAATAERVVAYAEKNAARDTDRQTFQAMEALVHNLNTMHSRAGAQTPFSSVNYGMDTSPEGRMVIKNMLLATEEGLGFTGAGEGMACHAVCLLERL